MIRIFTRSDLQCVWHPCRTRLYSVGTNTSKLKCPSFERKDNWESVVGLEVHAQIATNSKLFSKAGTEFGVPVNTLVSLFDASVPGTLPVLNKECVEAAVLTSISLACQVNLLSLFDRKHYFYSDLPSGYQITQQRKAIANNGQLEFVVYNPAIHKKPYYHKCRIRQIQLEQDSGKSLHIPQGNRSLIDLNRAGIALMEIVFEPDLKDGEEAAALVKELSLILELLGTCTCRMEEGDLRVDANISVNRKGEGLGTRTEVKNLSSIRSLANAIEFEVQRQIKLLEKGETVINETRGYDAVAKQTVPMRDKEVKQDYRFMPEPNLPPLKLIYDPNSEGNEKAVNIARVRRKLKELPSVTRRRLMEDYGITLETAITIISTPGCLEYFKAAMQNLEPKLGIRVANFIFTELFALLHQDELIFRQCPVKPAQLAEITSLFGAGTINYAKAKDTLTLLFEGDTRTAAQIVEEKNWTQVTDPDVIKSVCAQVLEENPKLVSDFKHKGKQKCFNKIVDLISIKTGGTCHMKSVAEITMKLLKES